MPKHILVTGGTGFLGSHIVGQLLEAPQGYKVKVLARKKKLDGIRKFYASYAAQGRFEAVELKDLVKDKFDASFFEGVDAVMHVASPFPGRETAEVMLETAIEGTLNIVRQAEAAGIRKIIVTSSLATVGAFDAPALEATSWINITREIALESNDPMQVYIASKTLAEKALWEFADAHKHLDVIVVHPSLLYGPIHKGQVLPAKFDTDALASDNLILELLSPSGGFPPVAQHADVRDAARVHVLALEAPPRMDGETERRFPVASPNALRWRDVLQLIKDRRPELAERVTKVDTTAADSGPARLIIEWERLESIIGFKKSEFKLVEDTILAAVDSVVEAEKYWSSST